MSDRPTPTTTAVTTVPPPELRVVQYLAAALGAALLLIGVTALRRVDFGEGPGAMSDGVAGFGFSPVVAILAMVLGGGIVAVTLANLPPTATPVLGVATVAIGLLLLTIEGEVEVSPGVERDGALLFVIIGFAVSVLTIVPRWNTQGHRLTALPTGEVSP